MDALFGAMASELRRRTLSHLRANGDVAAVEDVVDALATAVEADPDSLRPRLYHEVLPPLEELGAVELDADRERLIYRAGSAVTELIDWTIEREQGHPPG